MKLFAKVENTIVTNLVIAESVEWCKKYISDSNWIETFESNSPRMHCGVGWIYHEILDNFSEPRLYPSWILNESDMKWYAPIPRPTDGYWHWDEETKQWIEIQA